MDNPSFSSEQTLAEFYSKVKTTKALGRRVVIINDFDWTVSKLGPSGGKSPFDTILHPGCGHALLCLQNRGAIIGVISNRSGKQIARLYAEAGFTTPPYIMGTYGLEIYEPDKNNPQQGKTTVDPRFGEFKDLITDILIQLKNQVLEYIKFPESLDTGQTEVEIPTRLGLLYIENKAICKDYPSGVVNVYNLNLINPQDRGELVKMLDHTFSKLSSQTLHKDRIFELLKIWGVVKYGDPSQPGNYTWAIEPLFVEGKGEGLHRLLLEINNREESQAPIGMIIYGGDSDMDAAAMSEARSIANLSNGRIETAGVWVKGPDKVKLVPKASDIQLAGVDEYAKILSRLAEIIV